MLHLMFDPGGMRPFVERWDEVATSLIHRVRTEATGRVIDEKTKELLAALLAYSDVSIASRPGGHTARQNRPASRDEDHRATGATSILPMIPISFRKSLQRTGPQPREQTVSDSADESRTDSARHPATVGTPQTVAAQELRIETMLPTDEETEKEHLRLLDIVSV